MSAPMVSEKQIEAAARAILVAKFGDVAEAFYQPVPDDFPEADRARERFARRLFEANVEAKAALEAALSTDAEPVNCDDDPRIGNFDIEEASIDDGSEIAARLSLKAIPDAPPLTRVGPKLAVEFLPSSEWAHAIISPVAEYEGAYFTLIGSGGDELQNALGQRITDIINSCEETQNAPPSPQAGGYEEVIDAAKMARTRLMNYANAVQRGEAQGGGREFERRIWGAFSDFDQACAALAASEGGE